MQVRLQITFIDLLDLIMTVVNAGRQWQHSFGSSDPDMMSANEATKQSAKGVRGWMRQRGATNDEARSIGGHIWDVDQWGWALDWGTTLGHDRECPDGRSLNGYMPLQQGTSPGEAPEWRFAIAAMC